MTHYSRVIQGISNYIDAELVSKMAGSWKAWALGSAAGVAMAKAESIFRMMAGNPVAAALGIIDGENVNVDVIMAELRKQAQRGAATLNIPLIGPITFNASDVDALDRHIKGA